MNSITGFLGAIGLIGLILSSTSPVRASDPEPSAKRGFELLTGRSFVPPIWARSSYDSAWRQWQVAKKPTEYDAVFRERYGLHPAPYPNNGLPMGLRHTSMLFGYGKGIAVDCMVCHGGSMLGKSYIGLGNSSLEIEALFTELAGLPSDRVELEPILFPFTNVRGTMEAGAMSVWLFSIRNEDMTIRSKPLDLGLRSDLCEDTPPWWHFKKKERLYYNASVDARSVRTLMQFTMSPFHTLKTMQEMEPAFRDIQAYLKTIQPPKYPFAIDPARAATGKVVFEKNCAQCHGTYGEKWTYPNKLVDLAEIDTDPLRAEGITSRAKAHYDKTWFAEELGPDGKRLLTSNRPGYIAQPLDGIWASAPYLHNGSVPTVYHLLNSHSRPKRFTRSYQTNEADYDKEKLGWKVQLVETDPPAALHPIEKRKIYDTEQPGRSNRGHTFGDELTEEQRWALIEYLKTL